MNDRVEIIGEHPVLGITCSARNFYSTCSVCLRTCTFGGGLGLTCIVLAQQMTWATAPRPRMWHSQTQSG